MLDLAVTALLVFFGVEFIRALPWPAHLLARKPLSCDLCMVAWTLWGLLLLRHGLQAFAQLVEDLQTTGAAGGLALLFLALARYWRGTMLTPPS